jgi:hypothetical protein
MNNFYHYFAGFVILLGLFYLKIEHKFRWFVAFFIGILLWDEIYDLLRGVKDTTLLTIFFNSYLMNNVLGKMSPFKTDHNLIL